MFQQDIWARFIYRYGCKYCLQYVSILILNMTIDMHDLQIVCHGRGIITVGIISDLSNHNQLLPKLWFRFPTISRCTIYNVMWYLRMVGVFFRAFRFPQTEIYTLHLCDRGNRSTTRNPPTCPKSLTNFFT